MSHEASKPVPVWLRRPDPHAFPPQECNRVGCHDPADLPIDVEDGRMFFVCFPCHGVLADGDPDATWGPPTNQDGEQHG